MEDHKYNGHVEKKGILEIVVVQTEFIVTVCKSQ